MIVWNVFLLLLSVLKPSTFSRIWVGAAVRSALHMSMQFKKKRIKDRLHLDKDKPLIMHNIFIKVLISLLVFTWRLTFCKHNLCRVQMSSCSGIRVPHEFCFNLYQNGSDGSDSHALTHTEIQKLDWYVFVFTFFYAKSILFLLFGGGLWVVICCFLYFDKCSFCSQTFQCLLSHVCYIFVHFSLEKVIK